MTQSRGRTWFDALAGDAVRVDTELGSLLVADPILAGEHMRLLAIVPDPLNRFPRARQGEVGLEEGWGLARQIRDAIAADASGAKRPIIAIVDSRSQAYGRLEELLGIHLSLAAAADACATARMAGHPTLALVVGQAISGALLAHGMQAHCLLALDAPGVVIHAMHEAAAARVTRRSRHELEELGKTILPMSYDIRDYAKLGLLHELIPDVNADAPSTEQIERVTGRLVTAIADIRTGTNLPGRALAKASHAEANRHRAASLEVRRKLAEQWDAR
jgi:malonate decarboxylase gamma subunit